MIVTVPIMGYIGGLPDDGAGRCLSCRWPLQNIKNFQAFCITVMVPDGRGAQFALAKCQKLKAPLGFAPVFLQNARNF